MARHVYTQIYILYICNSSGTAKPNQTTGSGYYQKTRGNSTKNSDIYALQAKVVTVTRMRAERS